VIVLRNGDLESTLDEAEEKIRALWSEVWGMDDGELRSWLLRVPGVVLKDGVVAGF
jgi:hypothetical protein